MTTVGCFKERYKASFSHCSTMKKKKRMSLSIRYIWPQMLILPLLGKLLSKQQFFYNESNNDSQRKTACRGSKMLLVDYKHGMWQWAFQTYY